MVLASETSSPRSVSVETGIVLVFDLNNTLCKTDTLREALIITALRFPIQTLVLAADRKKTKAQFKRRVADNVTLAPDRLPHNRTVLDAVRAARSNGQRTALVSASEQRQVTAIAEHLGLFGEALGTGGNLATEVNPGGKAKAEVLAVRYGEKWLGRMKLLTHRGFMDDDPIVFAMYDRISLMAGAVAAVILLVAVGGW